jgi:excisionase family DNA binding protein
MTAPVRTAPARRARTVKQFGADYGVGKTLTYAEIKAGRLRAVKVGSRTLILNEDSEAWARSLPEVTP